MALTSEHKKKILATVRRNEQQEIKELLRSAVVRDKSKYIRKEKHKKPLD